MQQKIPCALAGGLLISSRQRITVLVPLHIGESAQQRCSENNSRQRVLSNAPRYTAAYICIKQRPSRMTYNALHHTGDVKQHYRRFLSHFVTLEVSVCGAEPSSVQTYKT